MWVQAAEPWPLPANPTLSSVASTYDALGLCADLCDAEWFHVFSTGENDRMAADPLRPADPPNHWFGPEITEWMQGPFGSGHSRRTAFQRVGPWLLFDTPGGHDELRARVDRSLVDLVDKLEPAVPPTACALTRQDGSLSEFSYGGVRSGFATLVTRVHDESGRYVGWVSDYRPAAPTSQMFSALALADSRHLDRSTIVARPGRRPAAVLFADLEASSPLAKRVSTAQYFAFGRRLVRAVDQCLIDHGGIVGRHAGDGITGFFLAETAGSDSAAARSCLEAATVLRDVLHDVVRRSDLGNESITFRFGLHWGTRVYVGQILTAGRSEVTALGDEVNDAARIEACASGGRTLVSKDLIECLEPRDAKALGIDPSHTTYTVLAELPTATEKARRDAPAIAVREL